MGTSITEQKSGFDAAEWPTARLERELEELKDTLRIPHVAERREVLARRAARVSFELTCRTWDDILLPDTEFTEAAGFVEQYAPHADSAQVTPPVSVAAEVV